MPWGRILSGQIDGELLHYYLMIVIRHMEFLVLDPPFWKKTTQQSTIQKSQNQLQGLRVHTTALKVWSIPEIQFIDKLALHSFDSILIVPWIYILNKDFFMHFQRAPVTYWWLHLGNYYIRRSWSTLSHLVSMTVAFQIALIIFVTHKLSLFTYRLLVPHWIFISIR